MGDERMGKQVGSKFRVCMDANPYLRCGRQIFITIIVVWLFLYYSATSMPSSPTSWIINNYEKSQSELLKKYPLGDPSNFTKIKYSGRTFDLTGCMGFQCNKDIEACDNTLPTSYNDVKEPPCCSHILRDMAQTFDGVMSKLGLEYFVGFGTSLG